MSVLESHTNPSLSPASAPDSAASSRAGRHEDSADLFAAALRAEGEERKALQDRIVEEYLEVADSVARRYSHGYQDWNDLRQVACLGLVKAVQRFDPEKGSVFVSYAVPTIAGEIKRYLRDHGWMIRPPRHIQDLRTTIAKATPRLAQSLGRTPMAAELAEEVGAELGDVEEALTCHESLRPASIDAPSLGGEGLSLSETLAADDDELARFEAIDALAPACQRLSDREKHILYLRFFEERTQQQIGDVLGVTQMQVSRLLSGILKRLREDLSEDPEAFPAATAPAAAVSKSPARPRRAA